MPRSDRDPLGPSFPWRLRSELDRVQPRWSSPRYLAAPRVRALRLAPAALAVALTGLLGITAYAATGSANPTVWTERVETIFHPAPPTATPEITPPAAAPQAVPPAVHKTSPKPSDKAAPTNRPQPSDSPEPRESPEPPGDHPGSSSNRGFPTPSPTPGDHGARTSDIGGTGRS
jgi:hypothetical protein